MTGNTLNGTGRIMLHDEMQAFDMLGPLSREALRKARFQIGAASLVRALVGAGADLRDPASDRAGARCISDLDCKLAYKFAVKEGFA
jgi:hypothetical protein